VQIAAHDVGRLSRLLAGCAGVAVAVLGALSLIAPAVPVPQHTLTSSPAAALLAAGLALSLLAPSRTTPALRVAARMLAMLAVALSAAALGRQPAAAVATMLTGLALACLDVRVPRPGVQSRFRIADPLLAGATMIALVALVPRMFAPTFPDGGGPASVMAPFSSA